jgi:hypothetical protein
MHFSKREITLCLVYINEEDPIEYYDVVTNQLGS